MKITHITTVHSRYDTRIFLKECSSLAKKGEIVFLVVADGKGDETNNGVQILDVEQKRKKRLDRMTGSVDRAYKRALETNADIFHLHDPELLRLVPRLLKHSKVIYDAHEDLPRQILGKHWIPKFLRRTISFLSEKVENHYAGKASGIVTATPFISDRFRQVNNNVVNVNNYPLLKEFTNIEREPSNEKLACYTDSRIGLAFLYAGIGGGGSCFPKDVKALIQSGEEKEQPFSLIQSVEKINQDQKEWFLKKILNHFSNNVEGKTFAIWGLSFKPHTDDIREAPSLHIISSLVSLGASIRAYDPVASQNTAAALE